VPPVLRDYQVEAVDAVWQFLATRRGSPLCVVPTGGGKSLILAAFLQRVFDAYPAERVLVLSHVRELLTQDAAAIRSLWPDAPVSIYSAGLKRRDIAPITVAGIQSIYKRADELGDVGLVVVDEAHLVPRAGEGMYCTLLGDLTAINPHLRIVGLSATPYRLGSGYLHHGEGALFNAIAYEIGVRRLIDEGWLSPLRSKAGGARANLDRVHVRGGEYVAGELDDACDVDELVKAACAEIAALTKDRRKVLVFCCGVQHTAHVAAELNAHGVVTESVTGDTDTPERDRVLSDFRDGDLRAVANCNVLTTGFDAPNVDCIVLLRPTMSAGLYVQMVGRGFRRAPGKADCLVADFAGNVQRHGPVDRVMVQGVFERAPAKARECPVCHELVGLTDAVCSCCGYAFPLPTGTPPVPQHGTTAADIAILSDGEIAPSIFVVDIDKVTYRRHEKRGKLPTLRVEHWHGFTSYSQWVSFEGTDGARWHAGRWWSARTDLATPLTIDAALDQSALLLIPARIVVDTSGDHPRIISYSGFHSPLDDGEV
jgi:DNA repair protein RadD